MGMASRSQLQSIHSLGSNRNATRVLKNMEPYLHSFVEGESIYYLNKAGRDTIGSDKVVTRNSNYRHTLLRNDVYIYMKCPENWINEYKIGETGIVADAIAVLNRKYYYIEVDNTQKMAVNKQKMEAYLQFKHSGVWEKYSKEPFPILLFYTVSEPRRHQLSELNPGLEMLVYTKKDLH